MGPSVERRKRSTLTTAAMVASIGSGALLPFALAFMLWFGGEFWRDFKKMSDSIQEIRIGMGQAFERGVAIRRRLDSLEARMERFQEQQR